MVVSEFCHLTPNTNTLPPNHFMLPRLACATLTHARSTLLHDRSTLVPRPATRFHARATLLHACSTPHPRSFHAPPHSSTLVPHSLHARSTLFPCCCGVLWFEPAAFTVLLCFVCFSSTLQVFSMYWDTCRCIQGCSRHVLCVRMCSHSCQYKTRYYFGLKHHSSSYGYTHIWNRMAAAGSHMQRSSGASLGMSQASSTDAIDDFRLCYFHLDAAGGGYGICVFPTKSTCTKRTPPPDHPGLFQLAFFERWPQLEAQPQIRVRGLLSKGGCFAQPLFRPRHAIFPAAPIGMSCQHVWCCPPIALAWHRQMGTTLARFFAESWAPSMLPRQLA